MSIGILQTMVLAAFADGKLDPEEKILIKTYQSLYPPLQDIPKEELDEQMMNIAKKKALKVKDRHIIEDIGEKMSKPEKETAFALAAEICASNFKFVPPENDLLDFLQVNWDIKKNTANAVYKSLKLRYASR